MKRSVFGTLLCALLALVLALGTLGLDARDASANGKPIKVILTYLNGLSNTGPIEATGLAEIVPKEGQVNVGVVGLPPLTGETYTGWIANTATGEYLNAGSFNTDQSEVAKYRVELPSEIPDTGWNLFLISIETNGPAAKSPGSRKSIAGYYPEPASAAKGPSQLPNTGGETNPEAPSSNPRTTVVLPKSGGFDLSNNFLTYGAAIVVSFGLGMLTRSKSRRK